ncbi:hypothetical protein [Labilibaculum sp.]|uniref:hypothetical protein n=1 Tax=Labilibaculum sp. TaxID=2060723 RepID=UPI00356179B9
MKANFLCPNCRSYLNVGKNIVVVVKNANGDKGILLLSIQLGDYKIKKHANFDIEDDEIIKIYCPSCSKSIKHDSVYDNIYKILMQDEEDQEYEILFSGIYGERCTYQIRGCKVSSFGEDAGKYLDLTI